MTDLSLLYGGDDNLLGDNMDNSYSTQKINKMSNNDMSIEDKSSKSQQIMLQIKKINVICVQKHLKNIIHQDIL